MSGEVVRMKHTSQKFFQFPGTQPNSCNARQLNVTLVRVVQFQPNYSHNNMLSQTETETYQNKHCIPPAESRAVSREPWAKLCPSSWPSFRLQVFQIPYRNIHVCRLIFNVPFGSVNCNIKSLNLLILSSNYLLLIIVRYCLIIAIRSAETLFYFTSKDIINPS